jgi:LAO/AO transport system kinase
VTEGVESYIERIKEGDYLALARAISMVENDHRLAHPLLLALEPDHSIPVIGITGPPGAGKSTLVNALSESLSKQGKRLAVVAVDPSSPFNKGSLLGDRIRMGKQFNDPNIFIRSMASRGALGGLAEKTLQITDVLKTAPFNMILVETVGVGQSEIDVVGLADMTVVVLVPESGDEIQHVKSGLMEIADLYVVNKADREGADGFARKLSKMLWQKSVSIPVIKTDAVKGMGIVDLIDAVLSVKKTNALEINLLTEQAWRLIQESRMKRLDRTQLRDRLEQASREPGFNIYRFVERFYSYK